jgi:hypothetical protein
MLPRDVTRIVLGMLPIFDLIRMEGLCKSWRGVIREDMAAYAAATLVTHNEAGGLRMVLGGK